MKRIINSIICVFLVLAVCSGFITCFADVVAFEIDENFESSEVSFIRATGDIDTNGVIDTDDILFLCRYILDLEDFTDYLDVNEDTDIDIIDLVILEDLSDKPIIKSSQGNNSTKGLVLDSTNPKAIFKDNLISSLKANTTYQICYDCKTDANLKITLNGIKVSTFEKNSGSCASYETQKFTFTTGSSLTADKGNEFVISGEGKLDNITMREVTGYWSDSFAKEQGYMDIYTEADASPIDDTPVLTIEEKVNKALVDYVKENGNASTQAGLLSFVNDAVSADSASVTIEDFFIYHAADGCFDANTGLNAIYKVNVKGHDGYVSAVFDIYEDEDLVSTKGYSANIAHIEENLGDLSTVTFDSSNEDFELDENGQITAYTGNAEKIVIPYSAGAVTFASNAVSTIVEGKTNNLTNVKAIVDFGTKEILPSRALQGASSLKAIVFGKYRRFYQEACLAQCPQLKCIQMPFGLNKNNNYHTISGNGTVYYRAFADCPKLSNVYLVQYSTANNSAMSVSKSFVYNLCQYASYQSNVFNNTAVMDFYYAASNVQTNLNSGGTTIGSSASVAGTRIGPMVWSTTTTSLVKVATLAKRAAGACGSTNEQTVKSAVSAGFVCDGVESSWEDFDISQAKATLNLTLNGITARVDIAEDLNLDTFINSVKTAVITGFNAYVANKGNNVEPERLLAYINKQIYPARVCFKDEGFYIRHAVDGCYGQNLSGFEFSIPGNDGSVVALFKILDADSTPIYQFGQIGNIPHNEENLGTLTSETYEIGNANFGIDGSGNITSYTGNAEMIIIPSTYSGRINMANTTNDSVKVIIVGDRSSTAMNVSFGSHSINNWENLRAVVLPKQIKSDIGINSFAFAYNPALKYVNLPNGINTTSNGYGTFGNEAFRDCPVLENARVSESGKLPSCQFRTEIFRGTSVRDYLAEGYFQFGGGASMTNISRYSAFTEGTQNLLKGNGNGSSVGANFVRAVALAQETADKYVVTNGNKATVLSNVVASYSSKISGITAELDGTNAIIMSYDGISVNVVCNKAANYNKVVDLVMSSTVTDRIGEPAGLLFSCDVNGLDILKADASVSSVALGMIIVPTSYISSTGFSKFDLTENDYDYIDIGIEYFDGNTAKAVFSEVLAQNDNRSFSAIAYAQITYTDTHIETVYSNAYVSVNA